MEDAKILLGEPPFSDLALEAVRSWTFEPAKRNGQPIAARIRFEILFHEPEPEPPPEPEAPPGQEAPKAPPPPPDAPVDVVVVGVREEPERVSMTRAEVREIPERSAIPFASSRCSRGDTARDGAPVLLRARGATRQRRLLPRRHPRAAALPLRARSERDPSRHRRSRRSLFRRVPGALRPLQRRDRRGGDHASAGVASRRGQRATLRRRRAARRARRGGPWSRARGGPLLVHGRPPLADRARGVARLLGLSAAREL